MSKCENCIHYERCAWLSEVLRSEGYRTDFNTRDDAEKVCDHYKDKSLCVELPCKVGDEVWFYKAEIEELCPARVIKIEINYFTPSIPYHITIQYKSILIGTQETKMSESVFNLLCHKSKEEAEAKLKEMK